MNWDGYISRAERLEALSYSPPASWLMGNRMVKDVFGQNSCHWNSGNSTYVWQDDAAAGTGLPMDGVIATTHWHYQLVTDLDGAPEGGWANPEYPIGTKPTGLLPTVNNIIRIYRPHTGTADVPTATTAAALQLAQQNRYSSLNLLFHANSRREIKLYADYADGQALLWTGKAPGPDSALNPDTYPGDVNLEAAFSMNRRYANAGSPAYQTVGTGTAILWHFIDGVAVDPARTLVGLTFRMTPGSWASGDFNVYAISADPPLPPKGTLLTVK